MCAWDEPEDQLKSTKTGQTPNEDYFFQFAQIFEP